MGYFSDHLEELKNPDHDSAYLVEVAMQFGSRSQSQFGNILIMAGGGGSGKDFTLENLVELEGRVLDVDAIKTLALKVPSIMKKMLADMGADYLDGEPLKDPEKVTRIHNYLATEKQITDKRQMLIFDSVVLAPKDRKPNLIFNITLKDLSKLVNLSAYFKDLGYTPEKTHLVWVANSFKVAKEQNATRKRRVSERILLATHMGASYSMKQIIDGTFDLKGMVDGTIFINFNQAEVDTEIAKSATGGKWIKSGNYIKIKETGKPIDRRKVDAIVLAKIKEYVPNPDVWDSLNLQEAAKYAPSEERERAINSPFKPFMQRKSFNGWEVKVSNHAISQLLDRYPSYKLDDMTLFVKKMTEWLNTKRPRLYKNGEDVMLFNSHMKVVAGVYPQSKEINIATVLEQEAKPIVKNGVITREFRLDEGFYGKVFDLDE